MCGRSEATSWRNFLKRGSMVCSSYCRFAPAFASPDSVGNLGVLRSKHVDLHGRSHDGSGSLEPMLR